MFSQMLGKPNIVGILNYILLFIKVNSFILNEIMIIKRDTESPVLYRVCGTFLCELNHQGRYLTNSFSKIIFF